MYFSFASFAVKKDFVNSPKRRTEAKLDEVKINEIFFKTPATLKYG